MQGVNFNLVKVYPRVCGGTTFKRLTTINARGLSPRVRGNLFQNDNGGITTGSIPACAGEPSLTPPPPSLTTVYPRVCGGTATKASQ